MGNTDGRVYSFAARTGQLAWATGTGAYVYASPAVEDTPGLGPTVYIGSYDGNMYAFNAQSGAVRWTHNAGGKISGYLVRLKNAFARDEILHSPSWLRLFNEVPALLLIAIVILVVLKPGQ